MLNYLAPSADEKGPGEVRGSPERKRAVSIFIFLQDVSVCRKIRNAEQLQISSKEEHKYRLSIHLSAKYHPEKAERLQRLACMWADYLRNCSFVHLGRQPYSYLGLGTLLQGGPFSAISTPMTVAEVSFQYTYPNPNYKHN